MSEKNIRYHEGKVTAAPAEAGYNPAKLNVLDSYFSKLIKKNTLQCASYLLARGEKVFACKSMGPLTYKDDGRDLMPDSIRRIASITKVFTAIGIMQLVENGELRLDQPVGSILKEFDNSMYGKINITHLLTHTSGIYPQEGYYLEPYPHDWKRVINSENWILEVLRGRIYSKPGEAWAYCNYGFILLGEIVARLSGLSYEDYVVENIIKPLGLKNTFFNLPAELHDKVCLVGEWEEERLNYTEDMTGKPPRAAGGLYSTLYDLWRLGMMFLNKGTLDDVTILGKKTVEAMTRNHLTGVDAYHWGDEKKSISYGLGLGCYSENSDRGLLSGGTFSHEGAGYSSWFVDPQEQFISVFFVPTTLGFTAEGVANPRNIIWSGLR